MRLKFREVRNPFTMSSKTGRPYHFEPGWKPKSCTNGAQAKALVYVDLQIEVHLGPIIKLADRFGIALAALELSVNLVVDG